MSIQIILLIAGFILLIKGASWFVDSASCIAVRAGIPQLVIGLTIVAMGTSLPEAAVSISSTLKGYSGLQWEMLWEATYLTSSSYWALQLFLRLLQSENQRCGLKFLL